MPPYTREVLRINQPQDLAGQDAWATTLVENKIVDVAVTFPVWTGFANVNDVLLTINADLIRGTGNLVLKIEQSSDGSAWSTSATFTFNYNEMVRGGGVERHLVTAPLDQIRITATPDVGTLWALQSITAVLGVFETSGGGGGNMATDPLWNAKGDLAVASANDTGNILPAGTTGQVLTADSTQPLGMRWANISFPGQVPVASDAIWDAKGDLAAGIGPDSAQRLPIGFNGQVLTANSGLPAGMGWAPVTVPDSGLPVRLQSPGPQVTDCNAALNLGFYWFDPSCANRPFNDYGSLLVLSPIGDTTNEHQMASRHGAAELWFRRCQNGTWQGWSQVFPVSDVSLPPRLGSAGVSVSDWNTATQDGYYYSGSVTNAPIQGYWLVGHVVTGNSRIVQTVWAGDAELMWRRRYNGSAWSAWIQTWPVTAATPVLPICAIRQVNEQTNNVYHGWQVINFDTEITDAPNWWTGGSRITVNQTGVFQVNTIIKQRYSDYYDTGATIKVTQNGTTLISTLSGNESSFSNAINVSVPANAGDYFEVHFYNASDANTYWTYPANMQPYFSVMKVA